MGRSSRRSQTEDLNEEASPQSSASGKRVRDGYRRGASPFRSPASGSVLHRISPVSRDLYATVRAAVQAACPGRKGA
jgi:hypothetical protein